MVELTTRNPLVGSVAPNTDAVRDAVNPFGGLEDVAKGIEHVKKAIAELERDRILTEAYKNYSDLSTSSDIEYNTLIQSINTADVSKIGTKVNEYIDGSLRQRSDSFLSGIPDKQVRQHFRQYIERDHLNYKEKGLKLQLGATLRAYAEVPNKITNNAVDSVARDPSNENRGKQIELVRNYINTLPVDPETKQKHINASSAEINESQIIAEYKANPRRFDGEVTVAHRHGSIAKNDHSAAALADSAGDKEKSVNEKCCNSIGLDGWDQLDPSRRRALLERLINKDNALHNKAKAQLLKEVKVLETLYDKGGIPENVTNKVNLDGLMDVFGVERGMSIWEILEFKREMSPWVAKVKTLPPASFKEVVDRIQHQMSGANISGEDMVKYGRMIETLSKARKESMELLHKDPMEWAIKTGTADALRFDSPEALVSSLAQRGSVKKRIEDTFGVKSSLTTKAEEGLLLKQLNKSSSSEFTSFAGRVWEQANNADKDDLLYTFERMEEPALASIFALTHENHPDATSAAKNIAVGAKHRKDSEHMFKAETGNSFNTVYENRIRTKIKQLYSNGESSLEGTAMSAETTAQTIELYILGEMHTSGVYKVNDRNRHIDQAIQKVLGGSPIPIQGCILLPARGMSSDVFHDTLREATMYALERLGYTGTEGRLSLPESYGYANLGKGKYHLTQNRTPVRDEKGDSVIIDLKNLPSPVIEKMAEEEKRRMEWITRAYETLVFNDA